ncbi:ubiquitin domain-containing protein DSK2a-like isoform X2 [Silene latifolia]|uniref:ubiquitin domain-containing protein DSK2a-like isoform X2 n=1 Tax=Silene latifolia TaxID=37657 RepID=UPI003D77978A
MATSDDSSDTTTTAAADESTTGDGGDEEVTVNIRCSNGSKFTVKTRLDSSVRDFKVVVAQNSDVPAEQQRLIYKGRILKDDHTLTSYGLQADHTIHMVRGFAPSASTTSSGAPNSGTPGHTSTEAARSATPTEGRGLGGPGLESNFPGLGLGGLGGTGASGLLGAGIPDFGQMQQQLNQNPNIMRDIMNMPAFQSLMNNPDIMRNLIMNNPQMQEIIDRNPELAHILNDPSILRQTLETARNPELMREMMRNTDRAMSNIESSPEGFNMLRRMYENVQEPFLNATTMAADSGNNLNSNPLAAVFGTQAATGGQQRDGSNNPSTPGSDSGAPNSNPLPNPWSNAPALQPHPNIQSQLSIQPHKGKSQLYQSQTAPDRTKNKLMAASISNFWNDYKLGKGVNDYLLAQTSRKQRKQKLSVKRSNANLVVFTGHNIYLTQQQRAAKLAREKRKLILRQRRIAKNSSSSRSTTLSSTITFDNIEQQLSGNENEITDNTSLQRHFEKQNMIRDIARDLSSAYESYEANNRLKMILKDTMISGTLFTLALNVELRCGMVKGIVWIPSPWCPLLLYVVKME